MEELVAQLLLAAASLSAGYAVRQRRLVLVAAGAVLAGGYIVQASAPGDARWGLVALCLNVGAGLYVFGYKRGAGAESNLASPT